MAFLLMAASASFAASIEKARLLYRHGLIQQAKAELIDVIFGKAGDSIKAEAYYLLGGMAFEDDKIAVALDSWRELVKKYPDSERAKPLQGRIDEIAEIVGDFAGESVDHAVALSYLRRGDFWSGVKSKKFGTDTSLITNFEVAAKWYDKVIREFPDSAASRTAYQNKMRMLIKKMEKKREEVMEEVIGWRTFVETCFEETIRPLVETFATFEKEYPNASTLQAFRYQIAQAYWYNENWKKAREWLNLIIKKSGEEDGFYQDTLRRRLKGLEQRFLYVINCER